jgi:hypothetical protein
MKMSDSNRKDILFGDSLSETIFRVWNKVLAHESLVEDPENSDDILAFEIMNIVG